MKFRKKVSYSIRRLIPLFGIAGITALGTVGCEKEDDFKSQIRTVTETKHDTIYAKPDTVYTPGDTVYIAGDTIYTPKDTIYLPGDTVYTPKDTVYLPSKPDTIYLPSKPDTIYTPSKPDTVYLPSKPDTIYIDNTPHHNTTYVWGDNNWYAIWPGVTDNVAKSADSTLVDKVILKNDGKSFGGTFTNMLMDWMNTVIESVSPENRYKVRGAGTLNETAIGSQQDIQDSIKLSNMGFSFGKVVYAQGFQR